RVSFEDALRAAAASQPGATPQDALARLTRVTPSIDAPLPLESNGVRLDEEIARASETSSRYAMLIGMLDRTMQIRQLAIKGM
ncbi:hypothetical protein NO135_22255, partial [Clostridioides difficile]|nr:hypothetical protein [Clostridioides difficile]